jgi:hypothetical protein
MKSYLIFEKDDAKSEAMREKREEKKKKVIKA